MVTLKRTLLIINRVPGTNALHVSSEDPLTPSCRRWCALVELVV